MTPIELNRLEELLYGTSMYKLREIAKDPHKEYTRSVLVVMVMELEFPDTPQEPICCDVDDYTDEELMYILQQRELGPITGEPGALPGESKEPTLEERFFKNEKWFALKRDWNIRTRDHSFLRELSEGQLEFDFQWGSSPVNWSSYSGPNPEDLSGELWVNNCFHKALFEIGEELECDPTFLLRKGYGTILLAPNLVTPNSVIEED